MPVAYKFFPDFDLLVTWPAGLVSSQELMEAYQAIFRDVAWRPGMPELADLRRVSAFDVDLDGFKMLSQMTEAYHGTEQAQTAVLIDRPMNEIISRLYQSIAETGGTETVRQFADARVALDWLGRPDFPLERLDEEI